MKKIWLALIVAIAAAVAASLIALPKSSQWTTDSPEALAAFEAAMNAKMKIYYPEAQRHLGDLERDVVGAQARGRVPPARR